MDQEEIEHRAARQLLTSWNYIAGFHRTVPPDDRLNLIHTGPYAYDVARHTCELVNAITDLVIARLQRHYKIRLRDEVPK